MHSHSSFAFLVLVFIVLFFVEDNYGSEIYRSISFFFYNFLGISIFEYLILILVIINFLNKGSFNCYRQTRLLFFLIALSLIFSFFVGYENFDIFSGDGKSGFREVRGVLVLIIMYCFFATTIKNVRELIIFNNNLTYLVFLSSIFSLVIYYTEFFSIRTHLGKITTFEGGVLAWWIYAYSFYFTRLFKEKVTLSLIIKTATLFLAIVLSGRRLPLIAAVITALLIVIDNLDPKKIFLILVIPFFLSGLYFFSQFSDEVSLIINLFSTNSSENNVYSDSNYQHIQDITNGFLAAIEHPILGYGLGSTFDNLGGTLEFSIDSGVHMQYWYFWIKLGLLGFVSLVYFYWLSLKYSLKASKYYDTSDNLVLSRVIFFNFLIFATLASFVGLNILGSNKVAFLTMFLFFSSELLFKRVIPTRD